MRHTTRRLLTGTLLVLAAGAGLAGSPAAAQAAGISATIDVNSTLKVRSAPSWAASVVGTLEDGRRVTVDCAVTGQTVHGKVRTTAQWDRLADGRFVSHAYVRTAAVVPVCDARAGAQAYVSGRIRSRDGAVNVRSGPSTSNPVVRKAPDGSAVRIVCAVTGPRVSGTVRTSVLWDRLADGQYVSHAYVVSGPVRPCPPVTPVPVPALTPEQFIAAAAPGARQGWREYGVPASVTIAQAILESGWGRSSLAAVDRNYFGIKCQKGAFGPHANGCHVYETTECDKSGECFATSDSFRTYASMGRSFRDHGHFLRTNRRYAPAFAFSRDADRFIMAVWKAGYATDPNYYSKVTAIMMKYDLYRYDTWK